MANVRVVVNGAKGRMGTETVQAVEKDPELELIAALDVEDDLISALKQHQPDVVVDFTSPKSVFENAKAIIEHGSRPVVGTTGLSEEQIETLQDLAAERSLGGLIAPNFAIGAVLMMKFAAEAARHLPHVEIIELHHDKKVDAPSGTAIKTAQLIKAARLEKPKGVDETEIIPGSRGGDVDGIKIHSVRLPGFVAHQEVIFGGVGQSLSIRHDSNSRESFMPGVCLACRNVMHISELVYGLEHLMK